MLTRVWGRSINNWILLLQQKLSYANVPPRAIWRGPKGVWEAGTFGQVLHSDLTLCGGAQAPVAFM